jgi:hypothetical protein
MPRRPGGITYFNLSLTKDEMQTLSEKSGRGWTNLCSK